jgi:hypothetical protein
MRKLAALILFFCLVTGFVGVGSAAPLPHSLQNATDSPVLLIRKKCKKVMVCDYFAPATSCSAPPCCKKWHKEKVCE